MLICQKFQTITNYCTGIYFMFSRCRNKKLLQEDRIWAWWALHVKDTCMTDRVLQEIIGNLLWYFLTRKYQNWKQDHIKKLYTWLKKSGLLKIYSTIYYFFIRLLEPCCKKNKSQPPCSAELSTSCDMRREIVYVFLVYFYQNQAVSFLMFYFITKDENAKSHTLTILGTILVTRL